MKLLLIFTVFMITLPTNVLAVISRAREDYGTDSSIIPDVIWLIFVILILVSILRKRKK